MVNPIRIAHLEWTLAAHPHPEQPGRWSVEIRRFGDYAGSAVYTPEQGVTEARVRRSGKRDNAPLPIVEWTGQIKRALASAW